MKAKKFITVLMLGAVPAGICAQQSVPQAGCPEKYHEGRQLCIEGHYYAASLSLTEYLKCGSTRYAEDAEALKLICSYYLNTSGTAEAMAWQRRRPAVVQALLCCYHRAFRPASQ